MIYSLTDKVFIGAVTLLYFIALMQSAFTIYALKIWLTNKREQRTMELIRDEQRERIRATNEVHEWTALLNEKDNKIHQLMIENAGLKNKKNRVTKLLEKSENERLKKEA